METAPLFKWMMISLWWVNIVQGFQLNVQLHYPKNMTRQLPGNALFQLLLCYLPGCPQDGFWNQTYPGLPYVPELTIYESDYAGNDLFLKTIDIPGYTNPATTTIYMVIYGAYEPPNDPEGISSLIDYCDNVKQDPASNYCVNVGMPYQSQPITENTALIVAFPYFSLQSGIVSTMFTNMYSPQFGVFRDIPVYIPTSLIQNPLNRSISVLIVNDGSSFFLNELAFAGGFDTLVLSGRIPETIMIGVPQNISGCERQYELTFSTSTEIENSCLSGGNNLYF